MKTITLKIRNQNNSCKKFSLLLSRINLFVKNYGLPENVSVIAEIKTEDVIVERTYSEVLTYFLMRPIVVSVLKTTNNRQLDFFILDFFGTEIPCEPGLDINKKERQRKKIKVYSEERIGYYWEWEYLKKWNPKVLNIADTGEKIILDGKEKLLLNILPGQQFEITLEVIETINIGKPIEFSKT